MTSPNQSNQQLYGQVKNLLHRWHKDPDNFLLNTLAMMVTGLFLGVVCQILCKKMGRLNSWSKSEFS